MNNQDGGLIFGIINMFIIYTAIGLAIWYFI